MSENPRGGDRRAKRGRGSGRRWLRQPVLWLAFGILVLLGAYAALLAYSLPGTPPGRQSSFATFSEGITSGQVSSVVVLDADNQVVYRDGGQQLWATLPANPLVQAPALISAVERKIPVRVDQQSTKRLVAPALYILPVLLLVAGFALIYAWLRRGSGFLKLAGRRGERTKTTFADVAGNEEVVAEVAEVRDYLMAPKRFLDMGADPPRGILLVGPPGTGKTLLARALAGEAGVPFFSISGTEFVEMYVGVGAARVRDLFRRVRAAAPAILFVDEMDAVGRIRSASAAGMGGTEERDQTLNQLLVEMDGFDRDSGIVVVGATNRADILDSALLRRGRFDRQIVVDRPERQARAAILELHARGKRLHPGLDLDRLAARTAGLTGADLASVLNEAALLAARSGRSDIGSGEVEEAVDRVLAGNERRTRLLSDKERWVVGYHESGHAVVAWAVPGSPPVGKVSVVSRGTSLGLTWLTPDDRFLHSKSELEAKITGSLAGMAAEQLVFGEVTTGSTADLVTATRLARRMVCELGMSDAVGRVALEAPVDGPGGMGGPALASSEHLAAVVDAEVRRITDDAFATATDALRANRGVLDSLVAALQESETLRETELEPFAARVVTCPPRTRSPAPGPISHLPRTAPTQ